MLLLAREFGEPPCEPQGGSPFPQARAKLLQNVDYFPAKTGGPPARDLRGVGHVGRVLDGIEASRPVELENDGHFLALVREMFECRGEGTARVTKVQGHAD